MVSRSWFRCVAILLAALGAGAGLSARQGAVISPKDQVRVTVVGTDIPPGPFVVDADGSIDYPFVGRISATGLTARELGAAIAKRLVDAQVLVGSPQVTVDLQQTANKTVTVSGAVNNRGEFLFAGDLTVFDALIRAGGAAPDAGDEILLIRAPRAGATSAVVPAAGAPATPAAATPGTPAMPAAAGVAGEGDEDVVTLSRRQVESGEFARSHLIEDGDRIIVSRARQVFIDGQVNRPGGYTVEAGMTLRQALSLAGGVTELGAVNRIRILRNGKPVSDVELDTTVVQPGDTITVPKRFM